MRFVRPFITPTSICANNTTQSAYLSRTLALIRSFQLNATYNTVLQDRSSSFVAYIQNPANQGLLRSNCSAFVTGVRSAKSADQKTQRARQQIRADIYRRFRQVPRDVVMNNGRNDMDSNEQHGHCF